MANTIIGIFRNGTNAQDAVSELRVSGFGQGQIRVFSPGQGNADTSSISFDEEGRAVDRMHSFFNALAEISSERDDFSVYSDLAEKGFSVLAVFADSREKIERAIEAMSHHSPENIQDYYSQDVGARPGVETDMSVVTPWAGSATGKSEKSTLISDYLRIYRHDAAKSADSMPESGNDYDSPPFKGRMPGVGESYGRAGHHPDRR